MRRLLRIDLTSKKHRYEEIPEAYANLGGRGLTSKIINDEVPPKTDPLGKENKLIFAAGILAGTVVPCSSRLSVGAKSPLTKGIKEANAGGTAGQRLARLGIQAIVVEGVSEDLTLVKVTRDGVTFFPAGPLARAGNYETIERLKNDHGEKVTIISIGSAGEDLLKAAAISVTALDFSPRMAARGGLGAVMGSKRLKAVILDDAGAGRVEARDASKLKAAAAALAKGVLAHPFIIGLQKFGTANIVNATNGLGCMPTKNFSMGQFEDANKISGEALLAIMEKRPNSNPAHRCMPGCIIGCSNVYTDEQGKEIVASLEYETIALAGSNCMISEMDDIALINRLCNDIGLDTIDVGAALGVAMEAGLLQWGDGKAACALVGEIGKGTEKGNMIGNGCAYTGERLNATRVPTSKGQAFAGYDPRVLKGTGVTYATSPMGADHTNGVAMPNPALPSYNPMASAGHNELCAFLQTHTAAVDSLGICLFVGMPTRTNPEMRNHLIDCIVAMTGQPFREDYLMELGASVLRWEKSFNRAAGLTASDDRLPEFLKREPLPPSGLVFDVPEGDIDSVLNF